MDHGFPLYPPPISTSKFDTPYLILDDDILITDSYNGGIMLVDFVRLLNIYNKDIVNKTSRCYPTYLYFLAFFRQQDHPQQTRSTFCANIADILLKYINLSNQNVYCMTRNRKNQLDFWKHEPCSFEYFILDPGNNFVNKQFTPTAFPTFEILYEGNDLFCILIKITP